MIGRTVSHYKIISKLGEGGMGVVYKAEDTKLKRIVALKFLSRKSVVSNAERTRFFREAQTAAALDHSNICTVHEINDFEGESFIAMAYVDGSSLKEKLESGSLSVESAVDIAIQVAEGLQAAHDNGVIHRDIKSANIMVTSSGRVKVTDFGLAKLSDRSKLTKTGHTVGTLAYMSPEQVRGEEVDHRADMWSLGVVLYEMLAGHTPFMGDQEAAVVYAIVNEEEVPLVRQRPDIPAVLGAIVTKLLQKNPDERYASTGELLSDLQKFRAGAAVTIALPRTKRVKRMMWAAGALVIAAIISILIVIDRRPGNGEAKTLAVVDFDIISGEEGGHLAVGLSEGISVKLSKLGSVRVASSDDIRRLRKKNLSAREVASQLGAEFALGGSLMKSGEQIRVTPQLIDASNGDVVWSELFDGELVDVFDFLDKVSLEIAGALELELNAAERNALEEKPTESAEAYERYLKGRHHYYQETYRDNELAEREYEVALKVDPDYPLALAGLADVYVQRYKERYDYDEYWLDKADQLVTRALESDPELAEAYESRAEVLFEKENCVEALEAAEKARELRPGWDEPYVRLGEIYQWRGELAKALELFEQAIAIRPSVGAWCGKGDVLHSRLRYDAAEVAYRAALEINPDHDRPYLALGRNYSDRGQRVQAKKMFRLGIEMRPDRGRCYEDLMWMSGPKIEELLRNYVEKFPYTWDAYNTLYRFLAWQVGDWPGAVDVVEQAAAKNPDRVWPYLLLALSRARGMATTEAADEVVEEIEQAVALRPNSGRVMEGAGNVYATLGQEAKALDYFERALRTNPGSTVILCSISELLMNQEMYDSAAVILRKAIDTRPGVTRFWSWSGTRYESYRRLRDPLTYLGRTQEYLDILEDAAEKYGRENPEFFELLGGEQCRAGRFEDAIATYEQRLNITEDPVPMMGFGMAQWLSGDPETALSTFYSALASEYWSDGDWGYRLRVISLLKYMRKDDEIESMLRDLRKESVAAWRFFAMRYYSSMRRFDDALNVHHEAAGSGERMVWEDWGAVELAGLYRHMGEAAKTRDVLNTYGGSLPVSVIEHANTERARLALLEGNLDRALPFAEKGHKLLLAKVLFAADRKERARIALDTLKIETLPRWEHKLEFLYLRARVEEVVGAKDIETLMKNAQSLAIRSAGDVSPWEDLALIRSVAALTSAWLGDSARAVNEIEYVTRLEPERADIAYHTACAYALVGDTTLALRWLETTVERGNQDLWWARVDPDLDALRKLPRFTEIMDDWDHRLRELTSG